MTTRHIYSAALSLVLGCGGGGGGGGGDDGDRADAGGGADAGDEEATTGRCAVERPGPATKVVFHDQDGDPLAVVTTNDDGIAAYDDCVEGGMVTVVNPIFLGGGGGTFTRLLTVQGVGVGDHVLVDRPLESPPDIGAMTVTVQNGDDLVSGGADSYQARLGDCTNSYLALDDEHGGQLDLAGMDGRCRGYDPDDFAVVSVALDPADNLLAFARVDSDDLVTPTTASGGSWIAYPGSADLAIENLPEGASGFLVVSPLVDGMYMSLDYQSFDAADEVLKVEAWPDAIADEHRVSISAGWGAEQPYSATISRTAGQPAASLDLATHLFQRPTQLVLDVTDPTRPVRRWNGGDDRAVLARSELAWTDGDDTGEWTVVAPGNPREIAVPILPDDLGAAGPTATSTSVAGRMLLVDKGIDYAAWLEGGLSSSYYDADSIDLPEMQEEEGMTIRTAGYWPN